MKNRNDEITRNITVSALFLALGYVLPLITGQIPQIGSMLLPMHMPVFLCGLICGWKYGLGVGLILPLTRYMIFGMPPVFPIGIAMTFELAAYGFAAGFLYGRSRWQCVFALYKAMIAAMLFGRIIWAAAQVLLLGIGENGFTWQMFIAGAFINAIPGILMQLVLIPAIMVALHKTGLVHFRKTRTTEAD